MKIVAKRADGFYLVSLEDDFKGFIFNPENLNRSPLHDIDSILKFGTWEEVHRQPKFNLNLIFKKEPQSP